MDILTNNLQKCKKRWKNLPLEAFINENTCQFKTCNICHYKSSLQYEKFNQSNLEIELLTPEDMSKQLFEKMLEIVTNNIKVFRKWFNWYRF